MICLTCNGLGRVWVDNGRSLSFCPDCDYGTKQLFKVSRLKEKDADLTLDQLLGESRKLYSAALSGLARHGGMLTIWGSTGVGKTHAAKAFVNYWIRQKRTRAQYWRMSDLLAWVMEDYDNRTAKMGIISAIPCLILDEMDKVQPYINGGNQVENQLDRAFGDVVSARYDGEGTTLCISNTSPTLAPPYIASRLLSNCLEVQDNDYRVNP